MTSPIEYTTKTTAETACSIFDNCVKKVLNFAKPDSEIIKSISTHPDRATVLNDDMTSINFNENATFFRDTTGPIAKYKFDVRLDLEDFENESNTYWDNTVDRPMSYVMEYLADQGKCMIAGAYETPYAIETLYKKEGKSQEETTKAKETAMEYNSIVDEQTVNRLITVGITASRIPCDIMSLADTKIKERKNLLQKRMYEKLHGVVRNVNSRISKAVEKKQPKSAFFAHARLWHAAKNVDKNMPAFAAEYQKFRQTLEDARV